MLLDDANLLFIRHAESKGNLSTELYVTKHNLPYDWDHLSKDHGYLSQVKYNYNLVDCDITEKGYEDCQKARERLQLYQPDLIIVSPLNRTLKTCSEVFPQATCPVIVQPILAEGLRSSADYSGPLIEKKVNYPLYSFDKVEHAGEFWFIKNESQQNQAKYQSIIKDNQQKGYAETIKTLLAYMLQTLIYETPTNLRQRTNKLKLLLKEYSQQYRKIAVVSHYNIIRFVLAKNFNQRDEPEHCHIANCQIRTASIDML